jgi:cytidylate kinase
VFFLDAPDEVRKARVSDREETSAEMAVITTSRREH